MPEYESKTIKYGVDGGVNWKTITFENGMYSYTDLDEFIHEYKKKKKKKSILQLIKLMAST